MTHLQRRFAKKHSHRYFVDKFTGDAVCLCGKVRGSKKATPGKYRAKSCIHNGTIYDTRNQTKFGSSSYKNPNV